MIGVGNKDKAKGKFPWLKKWCMGILSLQGGKNVFIGGVWGRAETQIKLVCLGQGVPAPFLYESMGFWFLFLKKGILSIRRGRKEAAQAKHPSPRGIFLQGAKRQEGRMRNCHQNQDMLGKLGFHPRSAARSEREEGTESSLCEGEERLTSDQLVNIPSLFSFPASVYKHFARSSGCS